MPHWQCLGPGLLLRLPRHHAHIPVSTTLTAYPPALYCIDSSRRFLALLVGGFQHRIAVDLLAMSRPSKRIAKEVAKEYSVLLPHRSNVSGRRW